MSLPEHRENLVRWVESQLIGPVRIGSNESGLLRGKPLERFPCGVLFPVILGETGLEAGVEDDEEGEPDSAQSIVAPSVEPMVKRRRYVPPSSAGFSFFISGGQIKLNVQVSATAYRLPEDRAEKGQFQEEKWQREPLVCSSQEEDSLVFTAPQKEDAPKQCRVDVFQGRAGVDAVWRTIRDGWLVTLTLFNKQELDDAQNEPNEIAKMRNRLSLFEASLKCRIDEGVVGDYPRVDKSLLTDEERELELQYRNRRIFAIGHACAADWSMKNDKVQEIRTEFMPRVEVPTVSADLLERSSRVLDIEVLATISASPTTTQDLLKDLKGFVDDYELWIRNKREQAKTLDDRQAAERVIARMEIAKDRMRRGVELLWNDPLALRAFALANRAMALQMRNGKPERTPRWRPFQLAFLLATIESTIDENSHERDLVDLIWFPTGGGKTEAYLGLIAFLLAWRRQRYHDSGGGTTAIMRYTLRLLTAQQFERASRLICALEIIRRSDPSAGLGTEPISLGMWVGGDASPNRYSDAKNLVDKAVRSGKSPPPELVLKKCPWCGEAFEPGKNLRAEWNSFKFICRNPSCDLVNGEREGEIPCQVVDEALYDSPPTLLIATLDKFARLAWEERVGKFLGSDGKRPPELIIQDELHLIAGALGSIAGLYEAALDTVLIRNGVHPKYVASTATIRMASDQVRGLYGRKLAVFPPPGLDCDDSYFARTVPTSEKPGRLYVGYHAPLLDRQHCLAPLAAALLAAPEAIFVGHSTDRQALLDAWWTMVVYHGSLKGVGNSHNAFASSVLESLRRFHAEERESQKNGQSGEDAPLFTRKSARVVQLTSNQSAAANAATFVRLESGIASPVECIDAVLATNMIAVGLDVARLALMVVNGQPLTTGEYIQSTSRVGRAEIPGVVFANYYRDQARSLSHFENFRPYHEAFYRFVEPTSVTPFTMQARLRALHAALVIVIRHSVKGMAPNKAAGQFRVDDFTIKEALQQLGNRCSQADKQRELDIREHLRELANTWENKAKSSARERRAFVYSEKPDINGSDRLLHTHGDKVTGVWVTLQSMRNVEDTALLKRL